MNKSLEPIINDLSRPFWDECTAGELNLPFCLATGRHFWPPSPWSPYVTAGKAEWRPASGAGRLASLVVFRRSFHPVMAEAIPYGVGLVELDAGPRLRAHIADVTSENCLQVGDAVRIVLARIVDGNLPVPVAEACASKSNGEHHGRARRDREPAARAIGHSGRSRRARVFH